MLLPIRTEMETRHTPLANLGLLCANVLVFLLLDFSGSDSGRAIKEQYFVLHGDWPVFYQLITYQFSHGDVWHLVGNMVFLWVFGSAVNAKMGDLPYLLFYIAGGMFAGLMFAWKTPLDLIGASGSIAAVTTAYLVLFPRSRVTVLYVLFFVGFITVPAMWIIVLKVIIWDNVIGPKLGSATDVAYTAHLAGYGFGFVVAMLMLLLKSVARDQFDMLALLKRWSQRRAFATSVSSPAARAQAQLGRVGKVDGAAAEATSARDILMDQSTDLRSEIAGFLEQKKIPEATGVYEKLLGLDPEQCLSAEQQLAIARGYYDTGRLPQAASAFEKFLARYSHHSDANEVRLLLGIINVRDLQQAEAGMSYLEVALQRCTSPARRDLAQQWLDQAQRNIGRAT
ncbi:MAG: rhomboid family intramembrane serine protease [Planctomycetes bacterium]|nr:rhomboid family intramembrane serine protease [Planctomycetota bacterium]